MENYTEPSKVGIDILAWCAGFQYNKAKYVDNFKLFEKVELLKDPKNKKDKFAVKIIYKDYHIGFIPQEQSEEVSKLIDSQEEFSAYIYEYDEDAKPFYKLRILITDQTI